MLILEYLKTGKKYEKVQKKVFSSSWKVLTSNSMMSNIFHHDHARKDVWTEPKSNEGNFSFAISRKSAIITRGSLYIRSSSVDEGIEIHHIEWGFNIKMSKNNILRIREGETRQKTMRFWRPRQTSESKRKKIKYFLRESSSEGKSVHDSLMRGDLSSF